MNSKQTSVLLGVVVVILLGLVGYLVMTRIDNSPSQDQTAEDQEQEQPLRDEVFVSTTYNFEFEYPNNLETYSIEYGPTDFDRRGLTVHIGTANYIDRVKAPLEGTEGEAVYFRVSAFEPNKQVMPEQSDCSRGFTPEAKMSSSKITLDGNIVTQCRFTSMFGSNSMVINFTRDGKTYYSLYSDQYADSSLAKTTIDKMIQTFKFEP